MLISGIISLYSLKKHMKRTLLFLKKGHNLLSLFGQNVLLLEKTDLYCNTTTKKIKKKS